MSHPPELPPPGDSNELTRIRPLQARSPDVAPQPTAEQQQMFNPIAILHALRRRWWLAVGAGIVFASLAAPAVWFWNVPQYTATATFRVSSKGQKILFDTADQANQRDFEIYKTTQIELLKSIYVATAALRDNDQLNQLSIIKEQVDPVLWLAQKIQVDFKGEIMYVSLTGDDPQAVTQLVNAVVEAYMNEEVLAERALRRARLNELEKLYAKTDTEVRNKRIEVRSFASTLGTDSKALALRQQGIIEQVTIFHGKRIQIGFDLYAFQSELAVKKQRLAEEIPMDPEVVEEYLKMDRILDQLLDQREDLEVVVTEASERMHPGAPNSFLERYKEVSVELDQEIQEREQEIRDQLADANTRQLKADIKDLELKIAMLERQDTMMQKEIQKLESQISEVAETSVDVEMMRPELEQLALILQTIAAERERMRIEVQSEERIKRRQSAQSPKAENESRRLQMTAMAVLLAFALPAGLILFWDLRARRINSTDDVTSSLGLAVLGAVPIIPSRAMQPGRSRSRRHQRWRALFTEAINGIVARMLREARHDDWQVFMVSSATSGEGKTTLATELAIGLARSGRSTVLVDFDLRRPVLDEVFDVPSEPGVGDLLRSGIALDMIVHETPVAGLSVIPAGSPFSDTLNVLTGGDLSSFFEQLRQDYEFVVVDASPILPVTDTRVISQHVDAVILSILRDVSQSHKVMAAYRMLIDFGLQAVGAVVTGSAEDVYYKDLGYATNIPA